MPSEEERITRSTQGVRRMSRRAREMVAQRRLDIANRTIFNGIVIIGGPILIVRYDGDKTIGVFNIGGTYGQGDIIQFNLPQGSTYGYIVSNEGAKRING